MKILLINNFYYNRGGDCTYLFALQHLLKERHHKVIVFSMHHPLNFDTEYSRYFVSYINYDQEIKSKSVASGLKVAKRTIYSTEAKKRIEELIKKEKPDIAHVQNIHHHITPSIFIVLKKYNIPILWTLHDYTIICPNTSFLVNGKICERCKKRKYFWPALVRCKKNSFAASTMAAIETTTHIIMKYYNLVDMFIAPSMFLKKKLVEYGLNEERIVHLNNFTCFMDTNSSRRTSGNYFIYLGRLSQEKGIKTLIDASVKVFSDDHVYNRNNYKLKIVGDGPLKEHIKKYIKRKNIENNVELLGHVNHDEAMELLRASRFLVIPSEWYENFPYSVLEAFSLKKPVIASRIGGIPELVKNWNTGLLFEPGNAEMLAHKINFMLNHPDKADSLGSNARQFMSGEIDADNHYQKLMKIYNDVIENNISVK